MTPAIKSFKPRTPVWLLTPRGKEPATVVERAGEAIGIDVGLERPVYVNESQITVREVRDA